eukprot:169921-Chlamydomonas_euryale.AAC.2
MHPSSAALRPSTLAPGEVFPPFTLPRPPTSIHQGQHFVTKALQPCTSRTHLHASHPTLRTLHPTLAPHLVGAARDDDRAHAVSGERHAERLDGNRVEVEDARVEVDRRQRAACDDDRLELGEDGLRGVGMWGRRLEEVRWSGQSVGCVEGTARGGGEACTQGCGDSSTPG